MPDEFVDLSRLAKVINAKLISRKDVVAEQFANGGYSPVTPFKDSPDYVPWSEDMMKAHLTGRKSYGHYMVGQDGSAKFFAFDIDLVKPAPATASLPATDPRRNGVSFNPREAWLDNRIDDVELRLTKQDLAIQLWAMAYGLAEKATELLDVPCAILYSGNKGLHVYVLTGATPAGELREAAMEVITYFGCFKSWRGSNFFRHETLFDCLEVELFPKQAEISKGGFGNLMRCPLGTNKKSGQESFFVKANGPDFVFDTHLPWMFTPDDPFLALKEGTLRG